MTTPAKVYLLLMIASVLIVVTLQDSQRKRAIDDSPEKIQLADMLINGDKATRQRQKNRPTPRPPGFFGTIWRLIVDQTNDTKSAYGQLSELFSGQFSDSPQSSTASPPGANSTETAPPRLSRKEFLDILRRNIVGLRRLYNLELREAMADSKKNIKDYKQEFNRKLYEQFRD